MNNKIKLQEIIQKNEKINKDNPIIGLHLELNIGVDINDKRYKRDIVEKIEDLIDEYLETENLIPLGGKCDFIRKDNNYGIKFIGVEK